MPGIVAVKPLLSGKECVLYGRLVRAFPGHVILAQVALSRLLAVDRTLGVAVGPGAAAGLRQWVADFVICRPDFTALAVVELDDNTAKMRGSQRERTRRKDQLLQGAGVKVVRVSADDIPDEAALKALVMALPVHLSTAQLVRRAS